ncbi:uncharacterized protein LOC144094764 [Amblyomma americanum]
MRRESEDKEGRGSCRLSLMTLYLQRTANPTSHSSVSAKSAEKELFSRQQPGWRAPPGILEAPQGFFSLLEGPCLKTLLFQMDQPPTLPGDPVQPHSQEVGQEPVLATGTTIGECVYGPEGKRGNSWSSPSTEDSSDDTPWSRGRKQGRSSSLRHRASNISASEARSMAPFWLLEDICHYFPRCQEDYGDPRGGAGRPSTRVVPSTLQFLRQPHYALATLCIVVVFALTFATIKTDVYVSIRHESRGYPRSHRSAAKPHPRRRRSDVSASQPTSLSCAWVNPPQQQLLARLHPWLRGPPGIVKIPQGFFSFPKGASSKALRFQTDHPPTSPPEGLAQLY